MKHLNETPSERQQSDSARSSGPQSGERASDAATRAQRPRAGARLLETPYCTIEWDEERSLARFVRTALPYSTIADIAHEGVMVERALEEAGRARLLVDLRAVAPRDEPEFEAAIAKFRRRLLRGCQQTAILVRTAMGVLQVKRHMREDGFPVEVFSQEEAALALFDRRPAQTAPRFDAPFQRREKRGLL